MTAHKYIFLNMCLQLCLQFYIEGFDATQFDDMVDVEFKLHFNKLLTYWPLLPYSVYFVATTHIQYTRF